METTTRLLLPEVTEALRREPEQLVELAEELHPADLADLAAALEPPLAQKLLSVLPTEVSARLLEASEEDTRVELFRTMALSALADAAQITDEMAPDDRADMYADLPEELRKRLLDAVEPEESRDIRHLLTYPEETAGAIMTTDFVALPVSTTAAEAIDKVRESATEVETIYWVYAVDPHGTLLGVISLRDLVTSPKDASLDEVMNPNIVTVDVDADQEEVARLIAKYDLFALPVVDRSHRILGIVTVDDILDIVEEEATEDVHKLGAVEPLEAPYLATPLPQMVLARAPWLIGLFIAVLFTENVLEYYSESGLESLVILMWFVPVMIASGGNAGSQSATLVIRAMAVEGISAKNNANVLLRELIVGGLLGGILAVVGITRIALTESTRSAEMAAAIGLSLFAVTAVGALLGAVFPLLLRRLRIDPAVSSTPFIATVVDVAGLVVYFEIAKLFLP
jgi:magnesium transporter